MDFNGAKDKLAEAFSVMQNLQVQPTKPNVDIISLVLNNLEAVFNFLNGEQAKVPEEEEKKEA